MSTALLPGYGVVRPLIVDDAALPYRAKALYALLAAHANSRTGHIHVTRSWMAARLACSLRTIDRMLKLLRLSGALCAVRTGDASHYYVAQSRERMARFNAMARAYYKRLTLRWTRIMERRTAVEIARQEALERIIVVGPGEVIDPTPDADNYLPVEPPPFFSEGDAPSVTPNTDTPLRPGSRAWQTARDEARAAWAKLIQRE